MFISVFSPKATDKVAKGLIPFRTMRETLEAIENYGEEMPPSADDSQYMFDSADDVDMDAFCDPSVDVQKLGVSLDEHTYFGEVAERLGLDVKSDSQ